MSTGSSVPKLPGDSRLHRVDGEAGTVVHTEAAVDAVPVTIVADDQIIPETAFDVVGHAGIGGDLVVESRTDHVLERSEPVAVVLSECRPANRRSLP